MPLSETIESFQMICDGKVDHIAEQAFFNVGGMEGGAARTKANSEAREVDDRRYRIARRSMGERGGRHASRRLEERPPSGSERDPRGAEEQCNG